MCLPEVYAIGVYHGCLQDARLANSASVYHMGVYYRLYTMGVYHATFSMGVYHCPLLLTSTVICKEFLQSKWKREKFL
jgi:hypothetical protein